MSGARQIFHSSNRYRRLILSTSGAVMLFCALSLPLILLYSVLNPPAGMQQKDAGNVIRTTYKPLACAEDTRPAPQRAGLPEPGLLNNQSCHPLRAAFYVNWDPRAMASLKQHIVALDYIFPEWLFLNERGDSIRIDIDTAALRLMRRHGAAILPMLSNYRDSAWQEAALHELLTKPAKRDAVIAQLAGVLKRYNFQGLNVDLEALRPGDREAMTAFMQALRRQMRPAGFMLTQDIPAGLNAYDVPALARECEHLVLMAYDLHFPGSLPGPVAPPAWVREMAETAVRQAAPEKWLLGLGAYGYDWPEGCQASPVSFREALALAAKYKGEMRFDSADSHLRISYRDAAGLAHTLYVADAATAFNLLRVTADLGMAGAALWRLGAEDERLWPLLEAEQPFSAESISNMSSLSSPGKAEWTGKGAVYQLIAAQQNGKISCSYDPRRQLITGERYERLPTGDVIRRSGAAASKQVVLSFNGGPDPLYTAQILDILEAEQVPAVFFVAGARAEAQLPLLQRIDAAGHEIGNHSYNLPDLQQAGPLRAQLELNGASRMLESAIGRSSLLFRPPMAEADYQQPAWFIPALFHARRANLLTVGADTDPRDWEPGLGADSILLRVLRGKGGIIMLHDGGGDRSATVAALGPLIRQMKAEGYRFTSLATLLGSGRDALMPPLPAEALSQAIQSANGLTFSLRYQTGKWFSFLFYLTLVLVMLRYVAVAVLAVWQRRHSAAAASSAPDFTPPLSVIIPAYNESKVAVSTIGSILRCDYPAPVEVVFVDDGSKDDTWAQVMAVYDGHPSVRMVRQANAGKAAALNHGINLSSHQFLVCIDADTQLRPDALRELMRPFEAKEVSAVAGNVKVGNEQHNLLTRWQAIEYITSQNFDRRAEDVLNAIGVVPGAIGAFRRADVHAAGGLSTDTLAEDRDLSMRLLKMGRRVAFAPQAIGLTEAPESLRLFMRQRFRWTYGTLQCLWKHKDALFKARYKGLGLYTLPSILLFQVCIALMAIGVDLYLIGSLFAGEATLKAPLFYALFTLIDMLGAGLAFRLEGETLRRLPWIPVQRLVFRYLLCIVLLRSLRAALLGELRGWGAQQRSGSVNAASFPETAPAPPRVAPVPVNVYSPAHSPAHFTFHSSSTTQSS